MFFLLSLVMAPPPPLIHYANIGRGITQRRKTKIDERVSTVGGWRIKLIRTDSKKCMTFLIYSFSPCASEGALAGHTHTQGTVHTVQAIIYFLSLLSKNWPRQLKSATPFRGGGGRGYIVKYVPQSKFGVNFSQATKVWCMREKKQPWIQLG
jgi:hypothetical protein